MIRVVKLVSGEEIIGDFEIESVENYYIIDKPVMMVATEKGYMFVPFMPYANHWTIKQDKCLTGLLEANDELTNSYRTNFGSGIQIVKPNPNLSIIK